MDLYALLPNLPGAFGIPGMAFSSCTGSKWEWSRCQREAISLLSGAPHWQHRIAGPAGRHEP